MVRQNGSVGKEIPLVEQKRCQRRQGDRRPSSPAFFFPFFFRLVVEITKGGRVLNRSPLGFYFSRCSVLFNNRGKAYTELPHRAAWATINLEAPCASPLRRKISNQLISVPPPPLIKSKQATREVRTDGRQVSDARRNLRQPAPVVYGRPSRSEERIYGVISLLGHRFAPK